MKKPRPIAKVWTGVGLTHHPKVERGGGILRSGRRAVGPAGAPLGEQPKLPCVGDRLARLEAGRARRRARSAARVRWSAPALGARAPAAGAFPARAAPARPIP